MTPAGRGATDVEVVAAEVFEEDRTRGGVVEHLRQGELGLQDRQVVAVAGSPILGIEGVRQPGQPLAQESVDLRRSQPVTDRLHRRRVLHRGGIRCRVR